MSRVCILSCGPSCYVTHVAVGVGADRRYLALPSQCLSRKFSAVCGRPKFWGDAKWDGKMVIFVRVWILNHAAAPRITLFIASRSIRNVCDQSDSEILKILRIDGFILWDVQTIFWISHFQMFIKVKSKRTRSQPKFPGSPICVQALYKWPSPLKARKKSPSNNESPCF